MKKTAQLVLISTNVLTSLIVNSSLCLIKKPLLQHVYKLKKRHHIHLLEAC